MFVVRIAKLIPMSMSLFPRRLFPGGGPQRQYSFPTPDADGPIVKPLATLATMIASTPTFRERAGLDADDPFGSEKLLEGSNGGTKRIFFPLVDWQLHDVMPSAVIQFGPEWQESLVSGGHRNFTTPSGTLRLILTDDDKNPGDREASLRDFGTYLGQFFDDLRSLFALNDDLAATGISQELQPMMTPDNESRSRGKAYWSASYFIEWAG